jgi:hypothetical protein
MRITTRDGRSFDTDTDLKAAERHILQKLMIWETLVGTLEEFRQKKADALQKGWNNSGPVRETEALRAITADMESKLITRLKKN